jgi:hypothetical protein
MPDRYRNGLERAFQLAAGGEDPTTACAVVIGSVVGHSRHRGAGADELRAYEVCYVDTRSRYLQYLLEHAEGEATCRRILVFMSVSGGSLGAFADDIGLDREALDERLANDMGKRITDTCPSVAGVLFSG